MITGQDIEYLVWTYDLSETIGRKIRDIVLKQHETIGFASYDELYQRISHLVERFTEEFGAKYWLRLDQGKNDDSRNPLHDIFGVENGEKQFESAEMEDDSTLVTFDDVKDLLVGALDRSQIAVLEYLVQQSEAGGNLRLRGDHVQEHLPELSARLEDFVRLYERNGKILIPRKPIVEIRWDPRLWVKFGRRNFEGSPLNFFQDNADVYGGMTRKELSDFDASLYAALRRRNQVAQAIPTLVSTRHLGVPPEDVQRIIDAHFITGGSSQRTSLLLGRPPKTVLYYWRDAGLDIRRPDADRDADYHYARCMGVDFTYLGQKMAEGLRMRKVVSGNKISVGNKTFGLRESLSYEDACDAFCIPMEEELIGYVANGSYLVRKFDDDSIDGFSALYLATISHTLTLGSVSSGFAALAMGVNYKEAAEIIRAAGIEATEHNGFPEDLLRKRIFNPSFGFALKHLDLW